MDKQRHVAPAGPPCLPSFPESTLGDQAYRKSLPPPGAAFALHLSEPAIGDHDLHMKITRKAYELFCKRGRADGCDLDDWLEAERLVLAELSALCRRPPRRPASRALKKS